MHPAPWCPACQVLTKAGFASKPRPRRGNAWVSDTSVLSVKRQQKLDKLEKTTQDLCVAWALSLMCGLGHVGHMWPAAPGWMHALHHPALAGAISVAALLGEYSWTLICLEVGQLSGSVCIAG